MTPLIRTLGLSAAGLIVAAAARAEPVTTIRNNGSPSNRVDIVIMGDGYTAAELAAGKYATDAGNAVAGLFAQQPYAEYAQYYNVHRIDVTSNQSGADHPSRGISVDTALGAAYDCGGITRLICVNGSAVNGVLSRTITDPNARDIILVLVNDPEYGGSGGAFAVASIHPLVVELVLHETGHSFALLADEYGGPPPPNCVLSEPAAANATMVTARASIKWSGWIEASTPVPTTTPAPATPGLYQGAAYCDSGMYRPTFNSKMRSLGVPFEQINTEQHVRRIYNFVSPVDSLSPATTTTVVVRHDGAQFFTIATPAPATHLLSIGWAVDGVPAGSGPSFSFSGSLYSGGAHTVTATVSDGTAFVRSDPSGVLRAVRTWNVRVTSAAVPIDFNGDGRADAGVFRPEIGRWFINGGATTDLGRAGDIPVPGDYDGNGVVDVAVYRPSTGEWLIGGGSPGTIQWGWTGDVPVPADYDGDQKTDTAVYRTTDGIGVWWLNLPGGQVVVSWGIRGDVAMPGDYDGDGRADLAVYRPATGQWFIKYAASGFTTSSSSTWGMPGDVPVRADLDNDQRLDFVVFRPSTGMWLMAPTNSAASFFQFGLPGDVPIGLDVDGDGFSELCVWRPATGTWFIRNRITASTSSLQFGLPSDIPLGARPRLPSAPVSDFDGDGVSDITVFRPASATWFTRFSSAGSSVTQWGASGDVPVNGDYDGDRRTDQAVYRPSTGEWFILQSSTGTLRISSWGLAGDRTMPADYDGDGRTDLAVFRPSSAQWFIAYSSNAANAVVQWGLPSDQPFAQDFDGDGRADLAVYRPSSGQWFVLLSTTAFGQTIVRSWGLAGDVPTPADFDGDGRSEIAVFRPSTGEWFGSDALTGTFVFYRQWGLNGDIPVPYDYDGDGVTDTAVFRGQGNWFIRQSSTGALLNVQWGLSSDQPR